MKCRRMFIGAMYPERSIPRPTNLPAPGKVVLPHGGGCGWGTACSTGNEKEPVMATHANSANGRGDAFAVGHGIGLLNERQAADLLNIRCRPCVAGAGPERDRAFLRSAGGTI